MTKTLTTQNDGAARVPGRPWVWFDLDDTLWDFRGNSLVALEQVWNDFELFRYFPVLQDWMDSYHRTNDALWRDYAAGVIQRDYLRMERFRRPLAEAGCPDREARCLSDRMDGHYLGLLRGMGGKVDGAMDLLRRLRPLYNIGVLSNGFAEVQHGKMETAGLTPLIDCVVLSDEIEVNKPDRRLYDHACRKARTTAAQSILIGDNPDTDIAGAIGAGWRAIFFCPDEARYNTLNFSEAHPQVPVVRSLRQIEAGDSPENTLLGLIIKKSA